MELRPTELSSLVGISVPYASQIIGGTRTPSRKVALRIFRRTGVKLGPIAHASDEDIDALERIEAITTEAAA